MGVSTGQRAHSLSFRLPFRASGRRPFETGPGHPPSTIKPWTGSSLTTTTTSSSKSAFASQVDAYWAEQTIPNPEFGSADESNRHLEDRARMYPLFREYMDAYGDHAGEVIVDYGCGPGNDTLGFALSSRARRVLGVDVSRKALRMAQTRLDLHGIEADRAQLLLISDSTPTIPLGSATVDYVHSLGVLHHTTHPGAILRELHRILKPGGRACVMVYNRDSIFMHLWIAYTLQIGHGYHQGLGLDEAFAVSTDGIDCPISRCYRPDDWMELTIAAGFEPRFVGGYFAQLELDQYRDVTATALADERLGNESRRFLEDITVDGHGHPRFHGSTAGHGGVFMLTRT